MPDDIVSSDSHVMEPDDLWWKAIGEKYGDRTPRVIPEYQGEKGRFFFSGAQVLKLRDIEQEQKERGADLMAAGFDPSERVKFQQRASVSAEVMNPTRLISIMHGPDKEVVRASARAYNDWIADFCRHDAERLIGVGVTPLEDPEWAVEELSRFRDLGLHGVIVPLEPAVGSTPYRHEQYDRFWATAADLNLPVILHELTGNTPDPFHFHTEAEKEESPKAMLILGLEITFVLANDFIFGGILDRHPTLKVICSEFEVSWLPYFGYRLDHMQVSLAARLELGKTKMLASDYLRSRIWHGLIDDPYVGDVISRLGSSQIMWGSDFPHVRSIGLDAQDAVGKILNELNPTDRQAVLAGNVREVYDF
jgi:uncharacterized protein